MTLDEVRLARLHLRVGMLSLAQAELEDLERRGELDGESRSLLAEARWRGGDAEGAAAAARFHLEAGGTDPIALCIAAEAAAADGRPGEARALMDRLGPPDAATLDGLFAGMPRRAFWPSGPVEAGEEATMFAELGRSGREGPAGPMSAATSPAGATPAGRASAATAKGASPPRESAVPGPKQVIDATEGLWPETPSPGATTASGSVSPAAGRGPRRAAVEALGQDPISELQRARAELPVDAERALLRLALTLRLDPTLAPAVLDLVAGRSEASAALIRGDAQRLLGRHLEAEAAFATAAAALGEDAAGPRK